MREIDSTESLPSAPAVCHALLVETPDSGLVLVEAGLGLDDVTRPGELLEAEWVELVGPELRPAETAVQQIAALGYDPADVRHILLTHLDVDHSGGLPDFPQAEVHVMAAELQAALTEAPNRRYRPGHRRTAARWVTYPRHRRHLERGRGGAAVDVLAGLPDGAARRAYAGPRGCGGQGRRSVAAARG